MHKELPKPPYSCLLPGKRKPTLPSVGGWVEELWVQVFDSVETALAYAIHFIKGNCITGTSMRSLLGVNSEDDSTY